MTNILTTLEGDAATEVEKLRAEMLTEMGALHTSFAGDLARARVYSASPIGHIIIVLLVFAVGVLIGLAL